jgi:hypothetical protein
VVTECASIIIGAAVGEVSTFLGNIHHGLEIESDLRAFINGSVAGSPKQESANTAEQSAILRSGLSITPTYQASIAGM